MKLECLYVPRWCVFYYLILFNPSSTMEMDLLNADPVQEEHLHKLKRLVQNPNSYFLDIRCKQCLNVTTVFSHSQTAVACDHCGFVLCTTTGGRAKLTVGSAWRRKGDWAQATESTNNRTSSWTTGPDNARGSTHSSLRESKSIMLPEVKVEQDPLHPGLTRHPSKLTCICFSKTSGYVCMSNPSLCLNQSSSKFSFYLFITLHFFSRNILYFPSQTL